MKYSGLSALALAAMLLAAPALAAGPAGAPCTNRLAHDIPARPAKALSGSAVMKSVEALRGPERDRVVERQVLDGNVPAFLRQLVPVTFRGKLAGGAPVKVTICVMPDYLAIGSDHDFVRTPLGLPVAAAIALKLGFFLPTPKMVDAIYRAARVHLAPKPMPAGPQMTSTGYLMRHNQTVNRQLGRRAGVPEELVAGNQKDLVLTNRLRARPGKVAIYGWHRLNGRPIQPLSTVHQAVYADYSHGIRLVSATAYVDGRAEPLAKVMQSPELARLVSSEGPIRNPEGLMEKVAQ
jgi:hypothetical protein